MVGLEGLYRTPEVAHALKQKSHMKLQTSYSRSGFQFGYRRQVAVTGGVGAGKVGVKEDSLSLRCFVEEVARARNIKTGRARTEARKKGRLYQERVFNL